MKLSERLAFLRQFRRQFGATGSVQPSSTFLASEMVARLREAHDARPGDAMTIVEMGPGTGSVTRAIAAAMGPSDRLDCYEINPEFARYLREQVRTGDQFAAVRERVRVHCAPAQDARSEGPVAFVICSVPLNNLAADLVEAIFESAVGLLSPGGGWLTFFEYPVLPELKRLLSSAQERARIDAVARIKRDYRGQHSIARLVPLNIPPARAVHIRVPGAGL